MTVLQLLEQNISMFVQAELENLQKTITSNTTEEEEDVRKIESEEEKENESSRENLMKILVEVLRSMGSNELADYLQNGKRHYTMGLEKYINTKTCENFIL